MKYYIAPRSGAAATKNFESTMIKGVPFKAIEQYLTPVGKELLLREDLIYAWGNRSGTKSQWESMELGDTVLFYAHGEIVMSAEVYYKQHSSELGRAMWTPKEEDDPWQYTFFLRNPRYFK